MTKYNESKKFCYEAREDSHECRRAAGPALNSRILNSANQLFIIIFIILNFSIFALVIKIYINSCSIFIA